MTFLDSCIFCSFKVTHDVVATIYKDVDFTDTLNYSVCYKLGKGDNMKTCDITQKGLEFAANKHSKGDTIRVFMYLCYEMDSSGFIDLTQEKIAQNMDLNREQVSRAISDLASKEIVSKERHETKGRVLIKINHDYANKDFVWLVKDDEVDWDAKTSGELL